jgi:hypothetical protein
MISVVLYGRNDSYGYNLHKRAALSLNCIAEVLDDPDDEILFVDYNTPDDFPTFPEAIQDTLTEKTKARLRILRARPSLHERFKHKTHLLALEPVARNIAVRRSNPANRWILSTNTDMIFVPRRDESLSAMVRHLPKGYYGIPRFELPESLWETLDRYDAPGTIKTVGEWGWRFHLNEIVYGAPTIKFDAPGDFQLIDREDLFRIHGFNEEMLLGWHVDSNLCKRLFMLYGQVGDLTDRLFGYHCDHTRQVTPMHRRTAVENNLAQFVDNVFQPELPGQAESWGCADAEIEDIRLQNASESQYICGLRSAIATPMAQTAEFGYVRETYDQVEYEADHILPYLTDVLASAPRSWNAAWFGMNQSMLDRFRMAWPKMGFAGQIFVSQKNSILAINAGGSVVQADLTRALCEADVFIFDFASADGKAIDTSRPEDERQFRYLQRSFLAVVKAEQDIASAGKKFPRRIIAINAIHNRFESLVRGHIEYARSPFSGRLRHGYVLPAPKEVTSWLGQMTLRGAGRRKGPQVRADQMQRGQVISGPHMSLLPGRYKVALEIEPKIPRFPKGWIRFLLATFLGSRLRRPTTGPAVSPKRHVSREPALTKAKNLPGSTRWRKSGAVAVEIRNGDKVLSRHSLSIFHLWLKRKHYFELPVTLDDLESATVPSVNVRIWTSGQLGLRINGLDLISGGTV